MSPHVLFWVAVACVGGLGLFLKARALIRDMPCPHCRQTPCGRGCSQLARD